MKSYNIDLAIFPALHDKKVGNVTPMNVKMIGKMKCNTIQIPLYMA